MTIAAGLRFDDGVLLCADSEITYGAELKGPGSKIRAAHFKSSGGSKATFAYSGSVQHAKMAIQQCTQSLAKNPPEKMGRADMTRVIAEQLEDFHQRHIFKHPLYQQIGGPDFSLIVGLWSSGEGLGMYDTVDAAIAEVDVRESFSCRGTGAILGTYLMDHILAHPKLKLNDAVTVAVYTLSEVKKWVPGCGRSSEILVVGKDGFISDTGRVDISHVEDEFENFAQHFKFLLMDSCDLDTPDEKVRERIEMLWATIEAIRAGQRRKDESRASLTRLYALMNTLRMQGKVAEF